MNLIDEIEGVIADIEAGQANEVCVRTLKRVCEALSATSAVEPSREGDGEADSRVKRIAGILADEIANLGYPVGMGMLPHSDTVYKIAAKIAATD